LRSKNVAPKRYATRAHGPGGLPMGGNGNKPWPTGVPAGKWRISGSKKFNTRFNMVWRTRVLPKQGEVSREHHIAKKEKPLAGCPGLPDAGNRPAEGKRKKVIVCRRAMQWQGEKAGNHRFRNVSAGCLSGVKVLASPAHRGQEEPVHLRRKFKSS